MFVFWLAHARAGVPTGWAVVYGVLVGIGLVLAVRGTTRDKVADAGRGLVIGVLLALVASSIAHSESERADRDKLAQSLSSGQNLTGIDLRNEDLAGDFIGGKVLADAHLEGADLHGTVLRRSDLTHADFHGSETNMKEADLSFAKLRGADLRSVHLEGANLTEADLRDARLAGAHLADAILDGADARGADLRDADLHGAQLLGTDLRDSILEAKVGGAVFSADLRDARLDGAAIKRLEPDEDTVFPPNFNLEDKIREASTPPPSKVRIGKGAKAGTVQRVVDGDTLLLSGPVKVRLLGIDAPGQPRPRECYALGATADVERLLPRGTDVRYTLGAERKDKFGRTLAYVWTQDGLFVNEAIVERGDAIFAPPPRTVTKGKASGEERSNVEAFYVSRLRKAQTRAEMTQRGLWAGCSALPGVEAGR